MIFFQISHFQCDKSQKLQRGVSMEMIKEKIASLLIIIPASPLVDFQVL